AAHAKLLVVEVPGVPAWRVTAHPTRFRSGRNTHASEKRVQRYHDARTKLRSHCVLVERNDFGGPALLAILGEESAAAVITVVDRKIDRQGFYFKRIAGLGPFDVHRAGENVTARSAVVSRDLLDDRLQRTLNFIRRYTGTGQSRWSIRQQSV